MRRNQASLQSPRQVSKLPNARRAPGWLRPRIATLRTKTLAIFAATLAGLLLIAYIPVRYILLESYIGLEQRSVQQNVERAANALADDIATLDRTSLDYAAWDDTYAYMDDRNQRYLENYVDTTFISNRLNLVLLVDNQGHSVFSKAFDLKSETEIAPPQQLFAFADGDRLLRHSDEQASTTGVIMLPDGPMLVAARPILTSDYSGPRHGTLIMGRALDAGEVQRLAETTRVSLKIYRANDPQLPEIIRSESESLQQDSSTRVRALSDQAVVGYTPIRDIYEKPALVVLVESPRSIYQQGLTSIRYFALSLLVAGLVFGLVVLGLLEWLILSRMGRLEGDLRRIGASGDQSERVAVEGTDELAQLAHGVNGMLDALDCAQHERRKADAERARLQEEFIRAREQLVQMAIHDLKNPLTAIIGFVHALRGTSMRPEQHILADGAASSAANMASLVETFLDLARMEEGRLTIHAGTCNVEPLLKGCVRELSFWAEQNDKQLACSVAPSFPNLVVDTGLVRRVILNLLSNAIKHTPPGTSITVGADITDRSARLWVRDTGQGISPELRSRIFERFSVGDQRQSGQSSTGLGLTFCKLAAEAHGGAIELHSESGKGATFVLVLPFENELASAVT